MKFLVNKKYFYCNFLSPVSFIHLKNNSLPHSFPILNSEEKEKEKHKSRGD